MNTAVRSAATAGVVVLLAAACGEPPEESDDGPGGGDALGCMVSDAGGINDKSFNETSWKGLEDAADAGVVGDTKFAESQTDADYSPNVNAMVSDECDIIVTVGHLLAAATEEAATANPDENFAIVDHQYTEENGETYDVDNVKPLVFNTQEAAFLAGYAAAGYSTTGKVGTWGGAKIPTVTIFMDGFYDGVQYYNEQKGADVQVLGWDKESQEGQFVGDFDNHGLAKQISDNLISQGADVLHPVGGPLASDAGTAAQEAGDVAVVWADSDGVESAPEFSDVILTSVLKGMDAAVETAVTDTVNGEFSNEPYVGTLENDGVGIAPFHEFDGEIPQELKDEIDQIRDQIISGDIVVESPGAF